MRYLKVNAPLARLLVLFTSLACAAAPDEPVAAACPPPALDTRQWREVTIENAGATILAPPDANVPFTSSPSPHAWSTNASSVSAAVSNDPGDVPARIEDFSPFPSWSWKSHRSQCAEHIDSTPVRVQAYFERWKGYTFGRHVAAGAYELVPGSWLVIGGVSGNIQRQQEVLAALRTVRFLPPPGSRGRPLAPACTALGVPPSNWREFEASSAPVTFRAPPGSKRLEGNGHEIWHIGPMRVDFDLLGTRSWVLESPPSSGSTWCSLTLDDRYTEVRVAPFELDDPPSSEHFSATAYVQMSPTRVLNIFAYIYGDPDGPERFFALLRSLRMRPISIPPHN